MTKSHITRGIAALILIAVTPQLVAADPRVSAIPLDQPRPLPGIRPGENAIHNWRERKFGMFIHFGLYSIAGGVWNGQKFDNGYSEQIMGRAPIAKGDYEKLAQRFDPEQFDPDAIVALAKSAGMTFIVLTAKHHDGFNLFQTSATPYNTVDGTPYRKDVVKMLADACRRGGLAFGVYYSTIDWHHPGGNTYIPTNSNPITPAQAAFNLVQIKELTTKYGPLSEIWFDMGKPTPAQSALFARTVHAAQPQTMISGRIWNHQGDFTVMGDNELPKSEMEEPWQSPASIFSETWGYRSWQVRNDLDGKIHEHIERLVHVVSAGGNYILNIGPKGDGSVVPFEADVLRGIGRWMTINRAAVFDTGRQPFSKLDFGFATTKPDRLYLFVRTLPADGKLRLPGIVGSPFGRARVLGHEDRSVVVHSDGAGFWIDAADLPALSDGSFMPVVSIELNRPLVVRPDAIAPMANGDAVLTAASAYQFQNYNGISYETPNRTYKLRWDVAPAALRYRATIRFAAPVARSATLTLIADGRPQVLRLAPGARTISAIIERNPQAQPYAMRVEVTPRQPFTKADALPVDIRQIELTPTAR